MAFQEIAIEPTAIKSMRDLQLVLSYVGFCKGRLIADLPHKGPSTKQKDENWAKLVVDSIKLSNGGAIPRICELLIRERQKIIRTQREYSHDRPWLQNARTEHMRKPFGALVVNQNPITDQEECTLDDFETPTAPVCFKGAQHGMTVPKQAADLAESLFPMLRYAKALRFVDPYFIKKTYDEMSCNVSGKHARVVKDMAIKLSEIKRTPRIIEFHMREIDFRYHGSPTPTPADQLQEFVRGMKDYLPSTWRAQAFLWKEQLGGMKFHARYILTDIGGVGSEYGWDEGNSPSDQTDLYLLTERQLEEVGRNFTIDGNAFDLATAPLEFNGVG